MAKNIFLLHTIFSNFIFSGNFFTSSMFLVDEKIQSLPGFSNYDQGNDYIFDDDDAFYQVMLDYEEQLDYASQNDATLDSETKFFNTYGPYSSMFEEGYSDEISEDKHSPNFDQDFEASVENIEMLLGENARAGRRPSKNDKLRQIKEQNSINKRPHITLSYGKTTNVQLRLRGGAKAKFVAEFVQRRSDNTYRPPAGCNAFQPSEDNIYEIFEITESRKTMNLSYKQARLLAFRAKIKLNLGPRFKTQLDFDADGGNCEPKVDQFDSNGFSITDPVFSIGDSSLNAKRQGQADYWISNKISKWQPYNRKNLKQTCKIVTQPHAILFWMCRKSWELEISNSLELLSEMIKNSDVLTLVENRHKKLRYDKLLINLDENLQHNSLLANLVASVGCWCGKLKNNGLTLMGKPLDDELDTLCYNRMTCLKCAAISQKSCNFESESPYNVLVSKGHFICNPKQDGCSNTRCECDLHFANNVKHFFLKNAAINLDKSKLNLIENGQFDMCKAKTLNKYVTSSKYDKLTFSKYQLEGDIDPEITDFSFRKRNPLGEVKENEMNSLNNIGTKNELADSCCGNAAPIWKVYKKSTHCCKTPLTFPEIVAKKYC